MVLPPLGGGLLCLMGRPPRPSIKAMLLLMLHAYEFDGPAGLTPVRTHPRGAILEAQSAPVPLAISLAKNLSRGMAARRVSTMPRIVTMRLMLTRGRGLTRGAMFFLLKEAKNCANSCWLKPLPAGPLILLPQMW
jgi:hypothetical protein